MANQPSPPTAQPPPDVPNDPTISPKLTDYLRRFSMWSRKGFHAKVDTGVAQSSILFQESGVVGVPRVYRLTVVAGSLTLTQVPLGEGQP